MMPRIVKSTIYTLAISLLFIIYQSQHSHAVNLVTSITTKHLNISSNFDGAVVTVFGSVEDVNNLDKEFDLVIVVRGPEENIVVRKKERIFYIWLKGGEEKYQSVPSYMSVHTSDLLNEIASKEDLQRYELGFDNLRFNKRVTVDNLRNVKTPEYKEAFIRLRRDQGLYLEAPGSIEFRSRTLFQTDLPIPESVSEGEFVVTTYLFSDQELLDSQTDSFFISKTGFNKFLFDMSKSVPLVYGLASVIMALFIGWLGGVIFRRN